MDAEEILAGNIDDFFEKKFSFNKQSDWILPHDIQIQENLWNRSSLTALKKSLNDTKSLLNDKGQDWHEHTTNINKASYVLDAVKARIRPEILTRAWCKFYEILSSYNLISEKTNIRTLHLCEAPGGFISALNYFLCKNHPSISWEWMATTLNPYYEGHSIKNVVVDDRLILPTLKHWYFGEDNCGDITDVDFIVDICNFVQGPDLFDLITADGSVNCLENPAEQEMVVEKLHFCEVLVSLNVLAPHGHFVLKKFTFFECTTISELYLLNCIFEKVCVFKPFTSRSSNSEVYVICLGFLGSEKLIDLLKQYKKIYSTRHIVPFFPLSIIPESFIQQIEECAEFFTDLQIAAIKENLLLYPVENNSIIEKLDRLKDTCAEAYIQKYKVRPCSVYDSLKLFSKKRVLASFNNESYKDMKSLYFYAIGDTFNNIVKSSSMQWYDNLVDVEKRLNTCFPISRKRPFEKLEWHSPWKEIRKRMKSKTYKNWLNYGRNVTCIQNSKFCDPLLLYLWNRISLDPKIDVQSHMKSGYYWYSDDYLEDCLKDGNTIKKNVLVASVSQKCSENDSFFLLLKEKFDFTKVWYLNMDETFSVNLTEESKIVFINSTAWTNSLHTECEVKGILPQILHTVFKSLKIGDTLLLCIQSILTRYMAGLIFMLISHFDKFTTILPEKSASAFSSQMWVFKNYQSCKWSSNFLQYLNTLKELNTSGDRDILQIVPMTSLCDHSFLAYLQHLNNKHLLQRLKSLITTEKSKVEKSV